MHSPSWFSLRPSPPPFSTVRPLPPPPLGFCNAVDTHDHSKELDEDEMWKRRRRRAIAIFPPSALVKYFLRRLARFAWLRYYDCRKFRGGRRGEDGEGEREREAVRVERRDEEERASEIREEGWANRANGQVAYLWRPYFRYMNWFPSKVRDAASFQFKMYREVSRRSPSNGKICEGHPPRALSYELNSVFLLSCEANAGTRCYYRFYGGTMGRPDAVNI